jgi:hypothetical protein
MYGTLSMSYDNYTVFYKSTTGIPVLSRAGIGNQFTVVTFYKYCYSGLHVPVYLVLVLRFCVVLCTVAGLS